MYHRSLNVPRSARNGGDSSDSGPNRRKAPSLDNPIRTHSTQSILTAMDRFVRSVNNMHNTILVPSRLRDMQLEGRVPPPHPIKSNDLHSFYGMLSEVKDELLWGPGSIGSGLGMASMTSSMKSSNVLRAPSVLSQKKTESLGSAGSDQDTDSDSVSETLSDTTAVSDESRDSLEHGRHLASAFRHHLQGLHVILHQLADSADYLSTRYQQEVEPVQH